MREILFRGKRIDNGEWVEGGLLFLGEPRTFAEITYPHAWEEGKFFTVRAEVDPKTVGQYTGLTDKNGKKIFEGDIVDLECDADLTELWMFDFGNCGGVQNVTHGVGYMGFYLRPLSDRAIQERNYGQRDDPIYYLNALGLHIVGNIHDNPELMKGGADNV